MAQDLAQPINGSPERWVSCGCNSPTHNTYQWELASPEYL